MSTWMLDMLEAGVPALRTPNRYWIKKNGASPYNHLVSVNKFIHIRLTRKKTMKISEAFSFLLS